MSAYKNVAPHCLWSMIRSVFCWIERFVKIIIVQSDRELAIVIKQNGFKTTIDRAKTVFNYICQWAYKRSRPSIDSCVNAKTKQKRKHQWSNVTVMINIYPKTIFNGLTVNCILPENTCFICYILYRIYGLKYNYIYWFNTSKQNCTNQQMLNINDLKL